VRSLSPGWETIDGTVLKAGLERSGLKYSPTVVYQYFVGSESYENNRISFPDTRSGGDSEIALKRLTAKYSPGGSCREYYNPDNPALSCLEPAMSYLMLCVLGPGSIGLVVLAVGTIKYGLWERRHGPTPIRVYLSPPLAPGDK
jgi:hypothetical protein